MKRQNKERCKGVISIFLAVILLPFFSITALFVESVRLKNAKVELEEALQSAGLSTLGAYEDELLDRFGLLAVTQETTAAHIFGSYLTDNLEENELVELKGGWEFSPHLTLKENNILQAQINEYQKLRLPTNLVYDLLGFALDGTGIADFFENMGKTLSDASKGLEATGKLADVGNAAKQLMEDMEELRKVSDQLIEAFEGMEDYFVDFRNAVEALRDHRATERPPDPPQPQHDSAGNVTNQSAIDSAQQAQDEWDETDDELVDAYNEARSAYLTALYKMYGVDDYYQQYEDAYKKVETSYPELETLMADARSSFNDLELEVDLLDDTLDIIDEVTQKLADSAKKCLEENKVDYLKDAKGKFQEVWTAVDNLTADSITGETPTPAEPEYWFNFEYDGEEVADYKEVADAPVNSSKFSAFLELIGDTLDILGDLTLMFNPEYAVGLSDETVGALPSQRNPNISGQALLASFADIDGAIGYFTDNDDGGGFSVLEFLKAIFKLLKGVIEFIGAFVSLVVEKVEGLINIIIDVAGGNLMDKLVTTAYIQDLLPHRLDIKDLTLHGPVAVDGDFTGILSALPSTDAVQGPLFVRCETEYVVYGSPSETVNQSLTFIDIFILRALFNIPTIMKDKGVTELVKLIPVPGVAPVVYILLDLIEAYIDTAFLVNGVSQPLIKDNLHFSLKAFTDGELWAHLQSLVNQIKDAETGSGTNIKDLTGGKVEYDFYLLLFLLMRSNESNLDRLGNVIQMEMDHKLSYTFRLDKTYTQVAAKATGGITPIFPLPGPLTDFDEVIYIGY